MANTFTNAKQQDIGTSYTTVFTPTAGSRAIILGVSLCNVSDNHINVGFRLNDGSGTPVYTNFLNNVPLPSGATLEVLAGQKYVVLDGESLEAVSDVASSLDIVIGVMEIS